MRSVRWFDITLQNTIPTSRHEEWHAEFPGENSPPKNLQSASVKRQSTTDKYIKHDAKTLYKHKQTKHNYSNNGNRNNSLYNG